MTSARLTSARGCAFALALSLLVTGVASAQRGTLNRFHASETTRDDFQLSRPGDLGAGRFAAQLHLDYGLNPLVYQGWVERAPLPRTEFEEVIVEHQLTGTLGLAYGFSDRYVVFAGLPVTLVMSGASDAAAAGFGAPGAAGAGLGDVYVGARARIVGEDDGDYVIGAQITATLPTAGGDYRGDNSFTVQPELLGEVHLGAGARLVLNLGALIRDTTDTTASNLEFGHELTYGVGAAVPVWTDQAAPATHLDAHLQLYGATSFALIGEREGTALETTVGLKLFHESGVVAGLATGPGLMRGFGSPDLRVIVSVGWAMPEETSPSDTDGDGIVDEADQCPAEPEDADGFEDEDGCPDPDNDGDSILDNDDQCPNEPETVNEHEDEDGCPDEVGDRDGDGLLDNVDQCPDEAEDADSFEDENGCPDPDNDSDGVLDPDDRCPIEPGVPANQGCSDPDRDGDTVVDRRDNCPDEPGPVENQGCAERQQVAISEGGLEIVDRVYFRTNLARIQHRSFGLLRNVADVLNAHPEIQRILVEGHTDDRGSRENNTRLSQARAQAVVTFLVERGHVPAGRLVAQGFGPDRPIVEHASTPEDLAKNRRVEFNIPTGSGIQERSSGPSADTVD